MRAGFRLSRNGRWGLVKPMQNNTTIDMRVSFKKTFRLSVPVAIAIYIIPLMFLELMISSLNAGCYFFWLELVG
jgi:hypothetical protein